MSGNKNSGRKPVDRIKIDYEWYAIACIHSGFGTRTALAKRLGTPISTIASWEQLGWPIEQHERLMNVLFDESKK